MGNKLTADKKSDLHDKESTSNAGTEQHTSIVTQPPTHDYPKKLTNTLNELRKEEQLCDIIVNVSGTPFHAHKAVLAASSNYFRAMFTSGFKEATDKEVKINGNPEIFEELLEYGYTGVMTVTPKTACGLLEMSTYLQFPDIFQDYFDILQSKCTLHEIPVDDVFKIYKLSKSFMESIPKDLIAEIMKCLYGKLELVKGSQEFLETADLQFLKLLLCYDDAPCDEAQVLEMVVCWLTHNLDERRSYASTLLGMVRLGVIAEGKLNKLIDAEILEDSKCQELLHNITEEHKSSDSNAERAHKNLMFSRRGTISAPITLITDCSFRRRSDFWIAYYSKETNWAHVPQLKGPETRKSLIQAADKLYAIGIYNKYHEEGIPYEPEFKECCEYDTEKHEWSPIESCKFTHENRSSPMIHHNGYIYVFGGFTAGNKGEGVERYDITRKSWEVLSPLPETNLQCTSAVVNLDGYILVYAVSPKDDDEDEEQNEDKHPHFLFEYNPSNNTWETVMAYLIEFDQCPDTSPIIYECHGRVYRILYRMVEGENDPKKVHQPVVNVIELSSSNTNSRGSVGDEICQDFIPTNRIGAFRIGEYVYVNACISGFVQKTDIRISQDQTEDIEFDLLDIYEMDASDDAYDVCGPTYFTFAKKLLQQDAQVQVLDALENDENLTRVRAQVGGVLAAGGINLPFNFF